MDWFERSQMCAHTDILEDFFFFLTTLLFSTPSVLISKCHKLMTFWKPNCGGIKIIACLCP